MAPTKLKDDNGDYDNDDNEDGDNDNGMMMMTMITSRDDDH